MYVNNPPPTPATPHYGRVLDFRDRSSDSATAPPKNEELDKIAGISKLDLTVAFAISITSLELPKAFRFVEWPDTVCHAQYWWILTCSLCKEGAGSKSVFDDGSTYAIGFALRRGCLGEGIYGLVVCLVVSCLPVPYFVARGKGTK